MVSILGHPEIPDLVTDVVLHLISIPKSKQIKQTP